jgi:hypothetical protein
MSMKFDEETLRRIIREELAAALSAPSPLPCGLDPAEVKLRDRRLLEAERTMPAAEFIIFQAEDYADRFRRQGQQQAAERMLRRAYAKADKMKKAA